MGKGTILDGGTGGYYRITANYYSGKINALKAELAARITDLQTLIDELDVQIGAKTSELTQIGGQITYYSNHIPPMPAELKAAITHQTQTIEEKAALQRKKAGYRLMQTAAQKRLDYLTAHMPVDPTSYAWCADKTENLSGVVGTIEVPDEVGTMLIQPGYNGNAAYSKDRDGQLTPAIAQTPEGVFYNLALLPGCQKWNPMYRFGTLTSVDKTNDTCSVVLESAISSAQGLNVNAETTLTGVPIEYMTCHAGAFSVGDKVVVEFLGDRTQPLVVGFKTNPKTCNHACLSITDENMDISDIGSSLVQENTILENSYTLGGASSCEFSGMSIIQSASVEGDLYGPPAGRGAYTNSKIVLKAPAGIEPGWYHIDINYTVTAPTLDATLGWIGAPPDGTELVRSITGAAAKASDETENIHAWKIEEVNGGLEPMIIDYSLGYTGRFHGCLQLSAGTTVFTLQQRTHATLNTIVGLDSAGWYGTASVTGAIATITSVSVRKILVDVDPNDGGYTDDFVQPDIPWE